ncbi:7-carboxy-7-deazaguanine synthase [Galdieria sulphuraria]|nr:7-carboxy-7-deazaguanine synthase [Galdieria sulphuraria]
MQRISGIPKRLFSVSMEKTPALLRVSEIFASVQGEGPFVGRPSVFLRLALCNLQCAYCDTKYTWLFEEEKQQQVLTRIREKQRDKFDLKVYQKSSEVRNLSIPDVAKTVLNLSQGRIRAMVLTGGEPLIQRAALSSLLKSILSEGYHVEIETNGTIRPERLPVEGIRFNVSPKLSNSFQPFEKRIHRQVLQEFLNRDAIFKFVITQEKDITEVNNLVDLVQIPRERVYLMPEGTDVETLHLRGRWLATECVRHGFRYSHRLHIDLWGNRRGV